MRLIDAEKLNAILQNQAEHLTENGDALLAAWLIVCQETVDRQRTIDATPVVHGRWEDKPTGRYGQQQSWCSACRKHSGIGGIEKNRHRAYCPNCGAKMDRTEVL